jgi:mannose-6-phosphate isomerase-like protein (cupin superfamily)
MQPDSSTAAHPVNVDAAELRARTLLRAELVADRAAFLDTRIPGSEGKINYPLIGPGVSENDSQVVPLSDLHGFNMGAAVMPAGVVNNLHLHFTAEVFTCMAGTWTFRWGNDGANEATVAEGDVISIPTWIFRGFTSRSDDAWLYTALGRDDGGGLIWAPSVIAEAARHGAFLSATGQLIHVEPGDRPEGVELVTPLTEDELGALPDVSPEQMRGRLTQQSDLVWSQTPFLDSGLAGGGAELALVIGYGLTEDRAQAPRLTDPHGLSLAWLRAAPGSGVGLHRHGSSEVIVVKQGILRVTLNEADPVSVDLGVYDVLSVPAGAWRQFESVGNEPALAVVITGDDGRTLLEWHDSVVTAARATGVALDANGYRAPAHLVRS